MEQTGNSDLQQFIGERSRLEAVLTRFKTYDTRRETEPIASLQERLDYNRSLLDRFETIQDRIFTIVAGTAEEEAHEQCWVKFEDTYYRLIGTIRNRI